MGNKFASGHKTTRDVVFEYKISTDQQNMISKADDSPGSLHYMNALALMKLRENYANRLSKIPKDAFRCILEYCEPVMSKWITEHYKYNPQCPINYTWPEVVSYQNPISAVC